MAQKQHIIEDKEVGELWKWVTAGEAAYISPEEGQELIRKLVEERAKWRFATNMGISVDENEREACRDFGIDTETWK